MGRIFTLQQSIIDIMDAALGDLILYLGKNCRIVYPPVITPCTNCLRDSIGNKSKNIYLHGGPFPFPQGSICPVCDGTGSTRAEEVTEVTRFIVTWSPKKFNDAPVDPARIAKGVIEIKGYIIDMPKISRMSYLVPHIDIEGYAHYRFRLVGEPISPGNIVQGKYFVALLERSAG